MGRKSIPEINGGSMADIAFIMLIFFIVSTTIASDKGVKVLLPKWDPNPVTDLEVNERNVLAVDILKEGSLSVEGSIMDFEKLKDECIKHLQNNGRNPAYADSYDEAVINIRTHPDAPYESYLEAYSNVKKAFEDLRNDYSMQTYGKTYDLLDDVKSKDVRDKYKLKIAEALLEDEESAA